MTRPHTSLERSAFITNDDTPGCTTQACSIRDEWSEFERAGAVVLGVSPDSEESHAKFRQKYGLPFTLLADPDHELAEQYGFWVEKHNYGKKYMGVERSTVVIDSEGNVAKVFRRVKPRSTCNKSLQRSSNVFDLKRSLLLAAAVAAFFFPVVANAAPADSVEVVVTLEAPPLAQAIQRSRVLSARFKAQRLNLRAPTSVAYLRSLATAQRTLAARITTTVPGARVTWRYQVVLDGLAVVVPRAELGRLASVPGVAKVWPSVAYRPLLDRSPKLIGADQLWDAPLFDTAGNGIKIGIIDDGVDQKHPFFNPSGYTMPPGFRRGIRPTRPRR